MNLERTFDRDWINGLVNDPSIRPSVGGDGKSFADLGDVIDNPLHLFLRGCHGGFGLTWSCPRVFEVHTFILPEGRGCWAYQAARDMIVLAKDAGGERLWTKVDTEMPHVRRFAIQSGMGYTGIQIPQWGKTFDVLEMVI
jgi:hypothetical protein